MILVAPWMLLVLVGYHAWGCADAAVPDEPEFDVDEACSFCRDVYGRG